MGKITVYYKTDNIAIYYKTDNITVPQILEQKAKLEGYNGREGGGR